MWTTSRWHQRRSHRWVLVGVGTQMKRGRAQAQVSPRALSFRPRSCCGPSCFPHVCCRRLTATHPPDSISPQKSGPRCRAGWQQQGGCHQGAAARNRGRAAHRPQLCECFIVSSAFSACGCWRDVFACTRASRLAGVFSQRPHLTHAPMSASAALPGDARAGVYSARPGAPQHRRHPVRHQDINDG